MSFVCCIIRRMKLKLWLIKIKLHGRKKCSNSNSSKIMKKRKGTIKITIMKRIVKIYLRVIGIILLWLIQLQIKSFIFTLILILFYTLNWIYKWIFSRGVILNYLVIMNLLERLLKLGFGKKSWDWMKLRIIIGCRWSLFMKKRKIVSLFWKWSKKMRKSQKEMNYQK